MGYKQMEYSNIISVLINHDIVFNSVLNGKWPHEEGFIKVYKVNPNAFITVTVRNISFETISCAARF